MSPLCRMITALLCIGLGSLAHAHDLSRECPSSPVAAVSGDSVSPFQLIWDVSDGTTSQSVPGADGAYIGFNPVAPLGPDDVLELLVTGSFGAGSTCRLEGVFEFADQNGVPQEESPPVVVTGDGFTFTLYQPMDESSRRLVRYRLKEGKATGCTLEELRTVAVTATVLKRLPNDGTCAGLACAEPQSSQRLRPVFYALHTTPTRNAASDYVATPQAPLRAIDLQCRAAADVSADDDVSPFDLIWDLDTGTTSQGVKQSTELLIFVTPKIMHTTRTSRGAVLTCEESLDSARHRVDFVPKVKIEVVVEDDKGNRSTETRELDAERQATVLSYPYINGGTSRLLQRVKVSAQGSSCFDLQVRLYTVDTESGETLAEVQLPAVVSKAVQPRSLKTVSGLSSRRR